MSKGPCHLPRRWLLGAALLLLPADGSAHPAQFTAMQFTVAPGDEFRASLNVDVLAFALGKPSIEAGNEELEALLDGPREALASDLDAASDQFRREVVVHTDIGDAATANWRFPGLPEIDSALASHVVPRILIGGEITFSGVLPPGARWVSVRLPYVLGAGRPLLHGSGWQRGGAARVAGGILQPRQDRTAAAAVTASARPCRTARTGVRFSGGEHDGGRVPVMGMLAHAAANTLQPERGLKRRPDICEQVVMGGNTNVLSDS